MPPIPNSLASLKKIADGGNSEVYAWENGRILKLFRDGFSRHAIAAELHHARVAHALGVPTPLAEGMVELAGRSGIVFERCDGQTLYGLIASQAQPVARLAQILFEIQRAIHHCRSGDLPPLTQRWSAKIRHARGITEPVRERALEIMRLLPAGERACHGDFHPANLLITPRGPMVIDWLDAGSGHPAPDIARSLLLIEFARPGRIAEADRAGFLAAYRACWRETWGPEFALVDHWRLPAAAARLAEVTDERERRALIQAIGELARLP